MHNYLRLRFDAPQNVRITNKIFTAIKDETNEFGDQMIRRTYFYLSLFDIFFSDVSIYLL